MVALLQPAPETYNLFDDIMLLDLGKSLMRVCMTICVTAQRALLLLKDKWCITLTPGIALHAFLIALLSLSPAGIRLPKLCAVLGCASCSVHCINLGACTITAIKTEL